MCHIFLGFRYVANMWYCSSFQVYSLEYSVFLVVIMWNKLAARVRVSVGCHAVAGWLVSGLVRLRCEKLLLGIEGSQSAVDIFLWLEWMPLGDGAARVGQHVGPVFHACALGFAANEDLPNGIVLADLVVVEDRHHHNDFLK